MSQPQPATNTELEKLSETELTLADADQDIRNCKVIDRHNEEIGHVSDLFIDPGERKVRMLEVRAGGFLGLGDRHFLLPVDAITRVAKDEVHVNQTRDRIVHSPAYDPNLIVRPPRIDWEPYYGYYGFSPYWGGGYLYPHFPMSRKEPSELHRSGYHGD
jgi:sporulation protein YlmC with PRC-barrel domain